MEANDPYTNAGINPVANEHVLFSLDLKSVEQGDFSLLEDESDDGPAEEPLVDKAISFKAKLRRGATNPTFPNSIEAFVQYASTYEAGGVDYNNPGNTPVPPTEVKSMFASPKPAPPYDGSVRRLRFPFKFKDNANDQDYVVLVRYMVGAVYKPYMPENVPIVLHISV